METSIEISKRQGEFPFASFALKQGAGWLYSTPVSKKAYSEPVREEFSVAVTGEIVRRWRSDINEPFKYEIFPGYLEIQLAGIVVLAKEVKKLLEKEQLLTGDDANIFIEGLRSTFSLFRSEIEDALKKETGCRLMELHPLIAYFRVDLSRDLMDTISYITDCIFSAKKEELRNFIARHIEELMTIKVVRKFKVIRE